MKWQQYLEETELIHSGPDRSSKCCLCDEAVPAGFDPLPLLALHHQVLLQVLLNVEVLNGVLDTLDCPGNSLITFNLLFY